MLKKWIMGLSSIAVISLGSAGAAQAAHEEGTINCDEFSTGEEVWVFWDEHGYSAENDPEGLDRDSDGLPCESLTAGMEDRFIGTNDNDSETVTEEDSAATEEDADTEEPAAEEADASAVPAEEESTEEGGALPDTATTNPMMVLFGVIAAGAGAALFIRRKTVQS